MEHWYTVIGTVEILRVYKSVVMGQKKIGWGQRNIVKEHQKCGLVQW